MLIAADKFIVLHGTVGVCIEALLKHGRLMPSRADRILGVHLDCCVDGPGSPARAGTLVIRDQPGFAHGSLHLCKLTGLSTTEAEESTVNTLDHGRDPTLVLQVKLALDSN